MLALTTPEDGFDPQQPYGDISTRVCCAVDFYGAVDLPNYHDKKMFLKTRAEALEEYKKASPLYYVRKNAKNAAPALITHGTADKTVAFNQSQSLADELRRENVVHEFVVVKDAPHSFDFQPRQQDLRPVFFGFLDRYLAR